MRRILSSLAIVMVLVSLVGVSNPASAQGTCLVRSEQRQAIRSGEAIRPREVRQALGGKILKMRLCRNALGLLWHVTTLQRDGRVVPHLIDARTGRRIR